jgi:hypothetical protein
MYTFRIMTPKRRKLNLSCSIILIQAYKVKRTDLKIKRTVMINNNGHQHFSSSNNSSL